jgi:PTS system nitrogen regulatory IIA component
MDLKIKDVADLLSVSETTIRRWLSEGKIPAYKINHQYRFDRREVENWLQDCKLKSTAVEEQPSQESEDTNSQKRMTQAFALYKAIYRGGVHHQVPGDTKQEVMQNSMKLIAPKLRLDPAVLTELLMDRENLSPTAFNHGIAVPHTRDFLLQGSQDWVSVVTPAFPVDWGALDDQPVHTLFFLFASSDKNHLHLLSKIAHLSSRDETLKFLALKPSHEVLLDYIKNWESKLKSG